MAFGFKLKQVKTKNAYTVDELYEAIKDVKFTAGEPELTKHGLTPVIVFPPLDRNNQVWILPAQFKAPYTKWTIQKNEAVGLTSAVVNQALDDLTDGLTRISSVLGKKANKIEELVAATAEELDALGL